jgi:phage baseplate assembly protein W
MTTAQPPALPSTALHRLGRGWAFPPAPGPSGAFPMRSGPAVVRQSILLILDTEPGERVMRPDFGCGLRRHLMEPNNPTTRAAIARDVDAALRTWEPRIDLGEVEVVPTDDPATVLVTISYTHVRDQSPDGLRLPLTLAGG